MLDLVLSRRRYLERLADGPAWKRDLIDEFDHSRSTVDRALDALTDAGLVAPGEAGYETTYSGRALLDVADEATAVGDTVDAAAALLNHLPTDAPRDHRFLVGAEVVGMDERSPAEVLTRMRETVVQSDRFRGAAFSANDDGFIETLYRRSVLEGATEVEFVVTPGPVRYVASEFSDLVAGILDSDGIEVRVAASMPFACYLATADGTTTGYLGVHGEHDNFLGFVANDRPGAVAWLESVYAERWAAADPFADFLADEGLSP